MTLCCWLSCIARHAALLTIWGKMGVQSPSACLGRGPVGFSKGAHDESSVGLQVPHIHLAWILEAVTYHIPASSTAKSGVCMHNNVVANALEPKVTEREHHIGLC